MKPLIERIKDRCRIEDDCWVWTNGVSAEGYPAMAIAELSQSPIYVRRLVYVVAVGPLHARRRVYSTCENRLCCNPDHLRAGTEAEIARTAYRMERQARGVAHSMAIRAGKRSWKLDQEKAAEIRRLRAAGVPREEVARLFGLNVSMVSAITSGRAWPTPTPWAI